MKKISLKIVIVTLLLLFVGKFGMDAQIHKVQASFITNFLRYIQWPDSEQEGEFIIGVVGEDPIYGSLMTMVNGKKFGFKTAVVKKISSREEMTKCGILFIAEGNFLKASKALKTQKTAPVLVITEEELFVPGGSVINFKVTNQKLAFTINQKNALARQLKISSKLINMGT